MSGPIGGGVRAARSPVLLTSLASAVLADGDGDVRLAQESRGAVTEWGGVYGQLVRLTGPWTVGLASGGVLGDLPSSQVRQSRFPGGWGSEHRWNGLDVAQDLVAIPRPAGAVRRLIVRSDADRAIPVTLTSRFSPYLFPVLVEGIRPVEFGVRAGPDSVSVRHQGFGLRYSISAPSSQLFLNRDSWVGGEYRGPVDELASEHALTIPPGGSAEVRWQIAGGLWRDLDTGPATSGAAPGSPHDLAAAQTADDLRWTEATPDLRFPDAPEIEAAYRSARAALRRLYTAPDAEQVGLVAGYPWYSAIWCRDLAVMLPALLWLGDFDWVARSLATTFRFQCRGTIRILGGEPGELPMQIAPGPIFLYGTSDSTLRFPGIVEQFHRHSGAVSEVRAWAEAVHRIVDWGRKRSDPTTGLLRHGGEVETISTATAGLARVHYGIDSPDTTIWDSADRRDHAIDVQVLWWQTLGAAAHLLRHADDLPRRVQCELEARRLAATLRARYRWAEERYLYDSIRDGEPVRQVRPNALRAVSADLLDADVARAAVDRVAADDLTTPWGVRNLSSLDPKYRPHSYHEGQVWTVATAWAADAAYAVGQRERGFEYLRTIAARYAAEGGFANECYRGDRPEPYNSCFVLGFSIAPFLTLLFERLWGIRVGLEPDSIRVRPAFPERWSSARLLGLRLPQGRVDLEWSPGRLKVHWTGAVGLSVDTGVRLHPVPPGATVVLDLPSPTELS
jgi:glycogen debranching enzyme